MNCVEAGAAAALLCHEPIAKGEQVHALEQAWLAGGLPRAGCCALGRVAEPGRPERPRLVAPDQVPRRGVGTREGHAALIHSIAHIEFNAINLALDCVARFSAEGDGFVTQWLRVAREECEHFMLLQARLGELGFAYGDFDAHNGLWEMAVATDCDFLARMALVPRLLEARGLDATPPIQRKLREIGDQASLAILDIILRDEIGHVAVGDHWFRVECARRGEVPEAAFQRLMAEFEAPRPKPPLNVEARLAAGFTQVELDDFVRRRAER